MLTAKRLAGAGLVAIAAVVLLAAVSLAADANQPPKPKEPPVQKPAMVKAEGTVHVTKDAKSAVTAVQLVAGSMTYHITLDKKGMELGEKMNGKKADVHGTVTEKNGQKWLTVLSYKPAGEKPKK